MPHVGHLIWVGWPRLSCVWACDVGLEEDVVLLFFNGRAFSVKAVRGFRLPRIEKALLATCCGGFNVLLSNCSHGKPGGDDGGLDACVGSSEKIALAGELDGAVFSEDGNGSDMMSAVCASAIV